VTLTTPRLDLEPVVRDDVDVLWAIWREPAVRRYLFDDVPVTRERVEQILDEILPSAVHGLGLWLTRERGSTRAVGVVGLRHTHVTHDPTLAGTVEVLVALESAVWGRGYATEALRAMLDHAFGTLGLAQLVAVVDVPNEASHRVIARLGFTPTGEHQGPVYRARTYVLTARDYATMPRP
jgi:[ribosomal protein S5]-alanine N-acetyltransferase